jgi:hypothetical protein
MRVRLAAISAIVAIALVVVLVAHGVGRSSGGARQPQPATAQVNQDPASVGVARVGEGDFESRITASGSITSIREAWLASEYPRCSSTRATASRREKR